MNRERDPLELLAAANPVAAEQLPDGRSHEARRLRAAIERGAENGDGGLGRRGDARRGRLLALAALALVGAFALSPLGFGLVGGALDRFGSWVGGKPGRPAPASEQAAFARENARSYARFPQGTRLRVLLRQRVNGRTFELLGFRSGRSLCLRLVRADRPGGRDVTACARPEQLPGVAAVLSSAWLPAGEPTFATGVFGFAADGVRAIEVTRERSGPRRAVLASNAFLSLRAQRTGTVLRPLRDPVLHVDALSARGGRVSVPFVSDYGVYPSRKRVPPSYMRASFPKPSQLPGPAPAIAPQPPARINWLEQHRPRGSAFSPRRVAPPPLPRLRRHFARLLQPDPASPYRLGVSLNRVHYSRSDPVRSRRGRTETVLCLYELPPLSRGGSSGCLEYPRMFTLNGPLIDAGLLTGPGLQQTWLSGLASDTVASIVLYDRAGGITRVPLHDNAYALQVRESELPGKLVARDARGRPLSVRVIPGPPRVTPCPRAEPPRRPPTAPKRIQLLDLARRSVAGATLLGKTPSQVTAVLGRPSRRHDSRRGVTLYFGRMLGWRSHLFVGFVRRGRDVRARSVYLDDPDLRERRLGHLLRLQPPLAVQRIVATYGAQLRLAEAYGSEPSRGCEATFDLRGTHRHVTLTLDPWRKRTSLLIWQH